MGKVNFEWKQLKEEVSFSISLYFTVLRCFKMELCWKNESKACLSERFPKSFLCCLFYLLFYVQNKKQRTWKSIQLTTKQKNILIIFTGIILRYRTKLIIHHGHFNYVSRSEKSFIKYERHFATHVSLRHVTLQSVTSPQRNFANASLRHKSHSFSIPFAKKCHFAFKKWLRQKLENI